MANQHLSLAVNKAGASKRLPVEPARPQHSYIGKHRKPVYEQQPPVKKSQSKPGCNAWWAQ